MPGKPTYEELEQRIRELEQKIAEPVQADTRARDTNELLSFFIKHSPIYAFIKEVTDNKSTVLYASDNYIHMTGIPAGRMVGKTMHDIFPWEFADKITLDDIDVIRNGHNLTLDETLNGKNYITYKFPLTQGGKRFLAGYTIDKTDLQHAESALRQSEERFCRIFNLMNDAIMIAGREADDFRFLEVNAYACKLLGYTRDELLNRTPMDVDLSLITGKAGIGHMPVPGGPPLYVLSAFRRKDGSEFPVELNAVAIEYEGRPCVLGVGRDITERKRIEKEKIEAQKTALENEKYALVGQIAGKMAHDFNNILAGILGNAQLELFRNKGAKSGKTYDLIIDLAMRGKNLTKNLVAFAKDLEPKQEYFSINEKMDLVLNILKKDLEHIDITRGYGTDIPELLADPGMIEHGLVNIVQNAVHATSKTKTPAIAIRTCHGDDRVHMEIEDNGCGIPEDARERIYEPAFTLKGSKDVTGAYMPEIKGTGYGMANVKKYIDQHKGEISVTSEVGRGTTVTICLPVIKRELSREEIAEFKAREFHSGKRILLVEDEETISSVQHQILSHPPLNHKVDIAVNGKTAMDLFDRNAYDVVSLDFVLPGRINGMAVYNHIRETDNTVPVLFISGNLEFLESIKTIRKQDPLVDHISKPCQNKDYVNHINRLLDA